MKREKEGRQLPSISAVFPAYNDGGTIASMVAAAWIALNQVTDDYEIIVVNDGSSDYTATMLNEISVRYPELRVITHPSNQGYGAALRTGFSAASKDWVFYTDGDSQYNPLELVNLVRALREGVDVVNGYKLTRNDSWMRIVIGRAYHYFVKFLFGIRIRDVDCDFRLIPRHILEEIELKSVSGAICLELVKKIEDAGYVFAEVPVNHYSRKYGVSQFFVPWRIVRTLRQLAGLYWMLVIRKEHLRNR
ncbi:MAG: glycosyltransferase family 2 protein [Anaerolineales bacterium]|uniref:glycosyltransferase family 2 protein n=1 Tax=Candidatus Villigracilis affinis TaxID=3140682 RepID=UPI002A19506A|nr:glycosyltransferase family 2 protein [Anaerolineales bacterium]MBL0343885.1 glycosyltransferase family 2 protein [Anaerolineales bacterium]